MSGFNLRAWFLRRLDSLLTEEQRRLPPDELSRLRVLVGAAAINLLLALSNIFGPEAPVHGTLFRVVGGFFVTGYLSALLLARRRDSRRLAALILCSVLTAGLILSSLMLSSANVSTHAVVMLITPLAVYLLGARWGFVFTAVMGLNILVLHPLFRVGFELDRPLFPDEQERLEVITAILALLSGWLLSWLHSSARAEAHAALRESENQLVSLIESTDDLVCSFNADGRILTANQAVRRLFRQREGGEPQESEVLFGALLPERRELWKEPLARALAGQHQLFEVSTSLEGQSRVLDISLNPILGIEGKPVGVTLFGRDITVRKEAEVRLEEMHRSLLEVSRQAGKAEIAVGVLHNIGNTLNNLTVSMDLVADRARGLRTSPVARVAEMLNEHADELGTFLSADPRGRRLPTYMRLLSENLSREQSALVAEIDELRGSVDHIQAVVSMQQKHARLVGMIERISIPQLIDDALRLQGRTFERLGIQVQTEYASLPSALLDRHKLLQILINLLSNARHALRDSSSPDKHLTIRARAGAVGRLLIEVTDDGIGIPTENLPRLFSQGFTTKEDGHGFGLHISSLAATEMGGTLSCVSQGKGQGATFTLELPLEQS